MTDDHAAAKAIYRDYLARLPVLERHRRFAADVVQATAGAHQTPVEPLATMGPNGGPLLCDVCEEPMILEGAPYHGVRADEAWRRNPQLGWTSYISGGMVIRIESNGTLRIYHGYPGRSGCVLVADKADRKDRAEYRAKFDQAAAMAKIDLLAAYFAADLPENNNDGVLTNIYRVMFELDPGLGINTPAGTTS